MAKSKSEPETASTDTSIPVMEISELEEIGIRLYGRWGWPVKLGRALGKDPSTLRRWRSGDSPIDLVSAAAIRDHDRRMNGVEAPHWNHETSQIDSSAIRTLRLIAQVQEISAQGAAVAIQVREVDTKLVVELRLGRAEVLQARQSPSGVIEGIQGLEEALERIWGKVTNTSQD